MLREHVRKTRPRPRAVAAPVAAPPDAGAAVARVGRLHAVADGTPWVTAPGWLDEPVRALLAAPPPGGALEALVGRSVILVPLASEAATVAILGWVESPAAGGPVRNLEVDGERIVIAASGTLELSCGEASITLTADGRVKIKGRGVLSHAKEVNRIRGGQVRIN